MSYPDAMDQDPAVAPPAAANNQDADIGQVAAAMQAATEAFNAPETSIEGTPIPLPAQPQNAVPSTETPPTAPPASSAPPQQPTTAVTQPATTASPAPASPAPGRTGTPMRSTVGGGDTGSRAGSLHPEPSFNMPTDAATHGAPARVYLNTKVTGVLLEGMKILAKDQPNDPLRVLGEFLLQRSKEIESSG